MEMILQRIPNLIAGDKARAVLSNFACYAANGKGTVLIVVNTD